jgi:hypothetical protein
MLKHLKISHFCLFFPRQGSNRYAKATCKFAISAWAKKEDVLGVFYKKMTLQMIALIVGSLRSHYWEY